MKLGRVPKTSKASNPLEIAVIHLANIFFPTLFSNQFSQGKKGLSQNDFT